MEKVYIYVFLDETGTPVYVGKANDFKTRYDGHMRDIRRYDTYFYRWLKKQIAFQKPFYTDILEVCNLKNWQKREKYWIKKFKDIGFPLTNMTDGGDGNNNQVFSRESIEKRNQKLRGVPRPQEVRDKISKSNTGKKLSEETKEKLRKHNLGKKREFKHYAHRCFTILQKSLDGTLIKEWKSISAAARVLGYHKGTIALKCKNKQGKNIYKNCIWELKQNNNNNDITNSANKGIN